MSAERQAHRNELISSLVAAVSARTLSSSLLWWLWCGFQVRPRRVLPSKLSLILYEQAAPRPYSKSLRSRACFVILRIQSIKRRRYLAVVSCVAEPEVGQQRFDG